MIINNKKYNLPARLKVYLDDGVYSLLIDRKSRIIKKDVEKIISNLTLVSESLNNYDILLKIKSPICSKAIAELEQNNINFEIEKHK